ncbi:MAG: DNA repair exonuclease [Eggerthellaceae bacterium]|nr:DNA repair exonuclease [Eggerthellaceae bacterium]
MGQRLTFIHAADLHIGAPIRGLGDLPARWAERVRDAIPRAWDRVVGAAVRHQVDFVAVAGDLFDTSQPSYRDYLRFLEGLDRLEEAGIPSYLCTGNHDPSASWQRDASSLPPHATMLSADRPDFRLLERDGSPLCVIAGRGYPSKVWSDDADVAAGITRAAAIEALGPRAALAPFGVGVLHTGLDLDLVKAPAHPDALRGAGFDYWALGHIHQSWVDDEADPRLVFPGCIQGRDIREEGRRGVYLVTLEEGTPARLELIPTASVALQQVRVDVAGCPTIPALVERVMRELFVVNGRASCEEMIARITLTGASDLHEVLARPGVLDEVRASINGSYPEFYCDALVDETACPRSLEALRAEGLFPAALLATADVLAGEHAAQAAYLQDEFLRRGVALPSVPSGKLDKLALEARDLVLDLLTAEDR